MITYGSGSWVVAYSGDETSEYGTVRALIGCRSVRLQTSPDYARNVPIMLESVPIMLALSSIFPKPYYAGIIHPSLFEGIFLTSLLRACLPALSQQ